MSIGVDWSYYNKFEWVDEKYLPARGEGDNMATQIVTAVNKLIYKWYNDGDVFDNTYHLGGWCNDLSSYANWLYKYAEGAGEILCRIAICKSYEHYEYLLKDLTDLTHTEEYLKKYEQKEKVGSIYKCEGMFVFNDGEDEDDDYYEDEEIYDDEEDE